LTTDTEFPMFTANPSKAPCPHRASHAAGREDQAWHQDRQNCGKADDVAATASCPIPRADCRLPPHPVAPTAEAHPEVDNELLRAQELSLHSAGPACAGDEDWRMLLRRAGESRPAPGASDRAEGKPGDAGASAGWWVPVFSPDDLARVARQAEQAGGERIRLAHAATRAMASRGRREVRVPDAQTVLESLRRRFPNFAAVVEFIDIQFALARHQQPEQFHIAPILLDGPPGVGKTFFSEQLAAVCKTALRRVSMASAQGGFELCGTSQFWSNAAPGAVFDLLAEHSAANGVLLLDELDKAGSDDRYPIEGPLLDLLEPRSACRFRDQALDVEFDASRLVVVATANDTGRLSAAIRSRFEVFQIEAPDERGREAIIRGLWHELVANLSCTLAMRPSAACALRDSGLSPREMRRVLRSAAGRALRDGTREIASLELPQAACARRIGF